MAVLGGAALAWPLGARAQQGTMPVIGSLSSLSASTVATEIAAFYRGLHDDGFEEGRNVVIDYRWADGRYERLPEFASELVQRPVALIVATGGVPPTRAAEAATSSIPIVFETGEDPVRIGLVANLNRPGGNVTGASSFAGALVGKQIELVRDLLPNAASVAVLVNPDNPSTSADLPDGERAARKLNLHFHTAEARRDADLEGAVASLAENHADALVVSADPFFDVNRQRIVALAAKRGIPVIAYIRNFVEAGSLASYGGITDDAWRQAGVYAGRILKDAKPGDLPVVLASKFELVINLKTAKTLGLTISRDMLMRADDVIE
jgi:putative tryptophan/tyrosine transport system substrate-binding protein